MDNFTSFFENTGSLTDHFSTNQAVDKAKSFAQKIGDLLGPKAQAAIAKEQIRAEQMDAKQSILPGISNSLIFYAAVAGVAVITYRLIFK